MALLPSVSLLDGWGAPADAANWAGVDDGLLRSLNRQLGDPNMDSLQVMSVIPAEIVKGAIDQATRGARGLNAVEKAQLVLMVNAVRHKYGLAPLQTSSTSTASQPMTTMGPTAATIAKIKIKLSQADEVQEPGAEGWAMEECGVARSSLDKCLGRIVAHLQNSCHHVERGVVGGVGPICHGVQEPSC